MAKLLLVDFEIRWLAENLPLFQDTVRRAERNRQQGIHPALLIDTFIDPRMKQLVGMDPFSKTALHSRVLELMVEERSSDQPAQGNVIAAPVAPTVFVDGDLFAQIQAAQDAAAAQDGIVEVDGVNNIQQMCEEELLRYKNTAPLKVYVEDAPQERVYNCPFTWWRTHATNFPTLAVLARTYLSVQATSAPSERIFSKASRIISKTRTRLDHRVAGKLLFVSENADWFDKQVEKHKAAVTIDVDIEE